jgi:DnaK suppressor protein
MNPLDALEARQRELSATLANREELAVSATVADALERVEDMQHRELHSDLLRMADRELLEVQAAIVRAKAGTYGECEDCGGEIGARRLAVRPYSVLCVTCAEARESCGRLAA